MTGFRLEHFPNVCHICLQYNPEIFLIALDTIDPSHGFELRDVVNELMFPISPELQHLTPGGICESCYKELSEFIVYRNRLKLIGKFVFSLALLQKGQTDQLEELLDERHAELLMVLRDLKVTDKHQLVVQDLLDEFTDCKVKQELKQEDTCIPDSLSLEAKEFFAVKTDRITKELSNESEKSGWEFKPDFEQIKLPALEQNDQKITKTKSPLCCNRQSKQAVLPCQCQQCSSASLRSNAFPPHKKNHQREKRKVHICKRCDEEFSTKQDLMQHKRFSHRDHMCDTCGLAFDTKFVLENHRKRHATERQYKCEYCPLEYYTKAEKLLHVRRLHLNAFEVSCPECALMFRTKQTLAQHMKTHTNQRTHTCNTCGFSFKSHTHLNRHTKELHEGVQYRCEHCDTTYRRKDKLRMHVEKMHNIQTYFVCDICLQSYDSDAKLQEHKAHHRAPSGLQCGVCLGAYVTKEELANHLCITYRESYVCCNRDFKYHYFYNKHMFLVHGEQTNVRVKPIDGVLLGQYRAKRKQAERCPKCEQEFATRQQKKNHMKQCGQMQYDNSSHVAGHEEELFLTMNTVSIVL
ncbi:zinc finger protein 605-like [Anopheles marshallii]|uniref:zinc finger protein 605-like n=1 Tax=Anopheles marshallii TaxID=1521116 RepID=UPI00237C156D|nr:zinc finger protein 605-like [Anopheles marshallii]